ncbi:hypothetical protein [Capnocytophaga gingivalis]|uniref:hypothetical protein n=1 Tax=Capnocytophaga gingivalis TaxID=1017 RepID=UPI0028EA1F87|nr:hypothetical protein [Capnocytophaga gingivalis]
MGQLSSVNYDDGNYEWFTYDKLGRIIQGENPTSQTLGNVSDMLLKPQQPYN